MQGNDYRFQFAGDWVNLHPDRVLVGRAVTCMFVPTRPDLNSAVEEQGKREERIGGQNSWVIDTLVENDAIVVDLFGKVKEGTFVRGVDPTGIANVTLTGINIRIGEATVLPGDVVLGTP